MTNGICINADCKNITAANNIGNLPVMNNPTAFVSASETAIASPKDINTIINPIILIRFA